MISGNTKKIKNIVGKICLIALVMNSCNKDNSDANTPPNIAIPDQSFSQSFESKVAAETQGWKFINLSDDRGKDWSFISSGPGPMTGAQNGTNFLYSDYEASTDVTGDISNWAISPKIVIQNGDKISFYARSNGSVDGYGDRLQLRMNIFNTSDSIGEASTDVGNFTRPLLDINPLLRTDNISFPSTWTKYEATISGLNKPDSGRVAIRYFLVIANGANGDAVGVDNFVYQSVSSNK